MISSFALIFCVLVTMQHTFGGEQIDCDKFPEVDENCCDVPDLNPNGLNEEQVADECIKEYKEGENKVPDAFQFECMEECILRKFGFLDDENRLNNESITNSINEQFTNDAEWKEKFIQASDMCVDGAHNMVDVKSPCKSGSGYFLMCFGNELIKNCPAKFWNESANCTLLQEYLDKCPDVVV